GRLGRGWMVLAAIVALAAALRILALGYGLPATYNPDETPIMNRALAFAKGDPNPHNFLYPSLYFYALFAWEVLFFVVGRIAGLFESLNAFQQEFFVNPSRLFLAGRALTAGFGIATVPALYWYGRRLYGTTTGLVAAAFLAVAPIAVRDAHYVKLDVPVTLFVVLAHAMLALIVTDPSAAARRRTWLLAGLFAGLAVSTHYYVAFIVVSIIAVAAAEATRTGRWGQSLRLLVWAGVAAAAGFAIGTPFFLVELQTAVRDIVAVREIDIDRAVGASGGVFTSVASYAQMLFYDALGFPVCLLAAIGFVWALVDDWRRGLLLVSFTACFLAFVSNTVPMSRYLNVVLPLFALAAAFAVTRVSAGFGHRAALAAGGMTVVALLPGFNISFKTDRFFLQTDTRTIAREFVEAHVPPGASILVQPYSAPLRQSHAGLVEALRANLGSESRASIKFQLMLGLMPYPAPAYRLTYLGDGGEDADKIYISPASFEGAAGLGPLRAREINYIILKQTNVENLSLQPLEAALAREAHRIAEFTPYRPEVSPVERREIPPFFHNTAARIHPGLERPGPVVEIWQLNDINRAQP
ncbi:MAG: glycosyltransferase family 39 protein, partial [Acidobacteriota bacterium]